ncbi:flavodoxin family protein [Blastococcus brunescens]|uniref:NAD(P)H-dependent oxidoreductase n=1 Tax=Blastococcus brunescens TaxID=1564165 RepID=A0ABZ1BBG2_9ACTN|nr:NAD(P)H-dependent oxidoreductase [Blastococcus sp. BMG 8361]WRL66655.1 NAD(P)H-dependent oxidoreductase [Blastococcus sp. BMG 8361]
MPRLLVIHHTPSPNLQVLLEAVREGAAMVEEIELVARPALSAGAADLLEADGVLLGTPANIGYMSGALKHFFDTVYYPCLDATVGLPYGVYVHGGDDTAGALTAIGKITGALRWKQVAAPLNLTGPPTAADLEACRELAATVAVSL